VDPSFIKPPTTDEAKCVDFSEELERIILKDFFSSGSHNKMNNK